MMKNDLLLDAIEARFAADAGGRENLAYVATQDPVSRVWRLSMCLRYQQGHAPLRITFGVGSAAEAKAQAKADALNAERFGRSKVEDAEIVASTMFETRRGPS